LQELEQDLLQEETQLPVFFTHETPELMSIYNDISKSVGANNPGSTAEGDLLKTQLCCPCLKILSIFNLLVQKYLCLMTVM